MGSFCCTWSKMAARLSAMRNFIKFSTVSILVVLILFLNICYALYEDQVGLFDWRQQYVGKVKFAYFNQYSHSSRRALVATESNVIAALNARTGSIIWRKVFENKHGNVDALLHHANALISVSGYGKMLRSWEPNKGHLQWEVGKAEAHAQEGRAVAGFPGWGSFLVGQKSGHANTGIVSLYNNAVYMYAIKDGTESWTWRTNQDNKDPRNCLAIYSNMDEIFVIMQKNEIFLDLTVLGLQNGMVKRNNVIPAPWLAVNTTKCAVIAGSYVACLNIQNSEVIVINMIADEITVTNTPFGKISFTLDSSTDLSIKQLGDQYNSNVFVIKIHQKAQVLVKINKENKIDFLHEFSDDSLLIASNAMSNSFLVSLELKENSYQIKLFELNNFKELPNLRQSIEKENLHGAPEYGSIYIFSKKDNELGYRLLVAFKDHSFCLIQQSGTILWEREESLAGIASVEMIELPASTSASKLELLHEEFASVPNSGILSMFVKRVRIQLKQLELLMASLKKRKQYNFPGSPSREQSSGLSRDQFGLHKIIVALTDSGKLFGLDTAKGKILWSRYLADLSPFHVRGEEKMMLYVQRTTAHFPLPPQCVVVGRKKSGHGTLVFAFNPLTGQPADQKNPNGIIFPFDIVQVSLLPLTDERFSKAILLVDDQLKIHIFPETAESVSHLYERINSIYLHLVDQEKKIIKGYMLSGKRSGKEIATVQEAWSVKFPEEQQIHRIACKRLDEHVHSVGRVLGDRSVLYKYLNPNLIAFATIIPDSQKPSSFIYVIDAVTGQIVHQSRHRSASGPIHMVLSENWLVYQIYNTKAKRAEISVIELYEGFEERNSTAFSSLESLDHPLVLSQGYLLPITGAGAMAVTNTERGITHKNLLLAMENGYIYSVPKNMLDPRRSFEQTAELAEEGLMPYIPELPMHPMSFINYNMTVEKIRGIHTSAAGLESTSLVFAYGLDLYFTRITPSKLFDVLKEDFDYIFISGVLSALILGTIISSKLSSFRKLSLSWL